MGGGVRLPQRRRSVAGAVRPRRARAMGTDCAAWCRLATCGAPSCSPRVADADPARASGGRATDPPLRGGERPTRTSPARRRSNAAFPVADLRGATFAQARRGDAEGASHRAGQRTQRLRSTRRQPVRRQLGRAASRPDRSPSPAAVDDDGVRLGALRTAQPPPQPRVQQPTQGAGREPTQHYEGAPPRGLGAERGVRPAEAADSPALGGCGGDATRRVLDRADPYVAPRAPLR